jgi:outer membrane immunogenic protein
MATPGFASDMPRKLPAYTTPANFFSWTGGYAGISLGGRWGDVDWTTTAIGSPLGPSDPTTSAVAFDSSAFRTGAYLGYNFQVAPKWLVGIEADAGWGRNNKTLAGIPGTFGTSGLGVGPGATGFDSSIVKLEWDGSLRGRAGFLVAPNWLVYATGGLAWQKVDINASCNGSLFNLSWCTTVRSETYSKILIGWTIGGGVEAPVWSNWLFRAEYRYADFGNLSHTFFSGSNIDEVAMNASVRTHVAVLGLAYKF